MRPELGDVLIGYNHVTVPCYFEWYRQYCVGGMREGGTGIEAGDHFGLLQICDI